ncbi:MAG: nitrogen fixation protein [Nitrospirae bacterium]|nr:nitrogen fixation protein [Nitrospirota bacterium]MBI5696495.1 nitrogen fixation protein [Nitrospirota bacterium]
MKIAVSSTDGKTVCGHLGRCTQFVIYDADGFDITARHLRKAGGCPEARPEGGVLGNLSDCQAVISQGIAWVLYDGLVDAGIIPVITTETDPESAVRQFLSGGMTGAYHGNCSCGNH